MQALDQLPMHVKHWTLLQKLVCLQRVDKSSEIIFIIGGDAKFFVTHFRAHRPDTAGFLPQRLAAFIRKAWLWSNTTKVEEYSPMGSDVAWRKLDAPPPDALARLLTPRQAPPPFAVCRIGGPVGALGVIHGHG